METKTFTNNGKEYSYKYVNYLSLQSQYKAQKMLMGFCYYKRYKLSKKAAKIRFNKVMKLLMDKITESISLGATVDFEKYKIVIDKRLTSKKTATVFNNMLYVPVIIYNGLPRVSGVKHNIKPSVEMQIRIRKAYQNKKYINL